jgi:hypothetical protein
MLHVFMNSHACHIAPFLAQNLDSNFEEEELLLFFILLLDIVIIHMSIFLLIVCSLLLC